MLCTNNYLITIHTHKHLPAAFPPSLIFERQSNWGGNGIDNKYIDTEERQITTGFGFFFKLFDRNYLR